MSALIGPIAAGYPPPRSPMKTALLCAGVLVLALLDLFPPIRIN